MSIRGIRGAIQVAENTSDAIYAGTRELLGAIQQANPGLDGESVASIFFTTTQDLDAAYPALAARQMGWNSTPLLCAQEIPVPGGLPRIVRVLLHWNTTLSQHQVRHVYLGDAARLRPDLNIHSAFHVVQNGQGSGDQLAGKPAQNHRSSTRPGVA